METKKIRNIRSIVGTIILGVFLAVMFCSIDVTPAFSKDYRHDKGRYQKRGNAYGHKYKKPAPRPYGYYGHRERAYYPPPRVVYAPPPPPGIGIFFPPIFIRP